MTMTVYSGSLQPKKKAELKEIALALRISDFGTKEEVQQRIRKHLDDNQAVLEDNPTFSGLFTRRKRAVPQFVNMYVVPLLSSFSSSPQGILPHPPPRSRGRSHQKRNCLVHLPLALHVATLSPRPPPFQRLERCR